MKPPTNITEKEYLKGDCKLNSSFKLYNTHSSSQKFQKQHFVMLLPDLVNEQQKVNKNIFEKCHMSFFQSFYKNNKGPYFVMFSFNKETYLIFV